MTDQDLIKKIKKLDRIHPSRQWTGSLRRSLVAQIDYELVREKGSGFGFFGGWLRGIQPMALAVSLILILVGGPWLALKASEPSLPGEFLYAIKRANEDLQKTIASNGEKTGLAVEFANRRLEELAKINEDSFSPEEKDEKTKEAIIDFKDSMASVSQQIKSISSKEEAVAVAKKTRKLKENLDNIPAEIKGDVAEAEKTIEEINKEILAVLVKDSEKDGEIATSTDVIDQEIIIFLETVTSTEEVVE